MTNPKKDKSLIYDRILESATNEFADKGYAGARMDEIAGKQKSTRR